MKDAERQMRAGHLSQIENREVKREMIRKGAKKKSRAAKLNFVAFFFADFLRAVFLRAFFFAGILSSGGPYVSMSGGQGLILCGGGTKVSKPSNS